MSLNLSHWIVFTSLQSVPLVLALIAFLTMKRRSRGPAIPPTPEQMQQWEARAPGWQVRCRQCGLIEPWGKYGVRRGASGKKLTWGYCSGCQAIRVHVVEKRDTV